MADPFDIPKCADCGKDVFPPEKIIALKKPFHKWCLKCASCKTSLTLKSMESWNNVPYCRAHMQLAKMGGGTQDLRTAQGSGEVVSASTKVSGSNQSTENAPVASSISYEKRGQDQSTENKPVSRTISYEQRGGGQSTESNPTASAFKQQQQPAARPAPSGQVSKAAFQQQPAQSSASAPRAAPAPKPAPAPAPIKKAAAAPPPEPEPEPAYEEPAREEPAAAQDEWAEQPAEETYTETSATEEVTEQLAGLSVGQTVLAVYSGDGQQYEATIDEAANGQYLVNYGAVFNNETEWLSTDRITPL